MGEPVAVAPGLIVGIGDVARYDLLQQPRYIIEQTGFIFDGTDGGSRPGHGHGADALLEVGFLHNTTDIGGDVMDAAEASGLDLYSVSENRHNQISL